jgi:hypothetical protein
VDHGEGTSSRFKEKNKNDKRCHDDNLVAAVERKASRPKGNPSKVGLPKDHFEKLLDASCPHHEVPVKHALKNYVNVSQGRRIHPRRRCRLPTMTTTTTRVLGTRVKTTWST